MVRTNPRIPWQLLGIDSLRLMDLRSTSTEQLLDFCLNQGGEQVWEEFVRRFQPLIAGVVATITRRWNSTASPELVDDLVQTTYLKLCGDDFAALRSFCFSHPDALLGYLKVIASNVAYDHFRREQSLKRGSGKSGKNPLEENTILDESFRDTVERSILMREVEQCLRRVLTGPESRRDQTIFWMYYRQGLTARTIASLPSIGLTVKGVESVLLRLTRLVRSHLRLFESQSNSEEQQR